MKTFMPELPPEQRLQLLKDNCDSREETTYYRDLSQEELSFKWEKLSDNLVQLSDWDEELGDIKDGFKTKMKPLKEDNKELLFEIKTKKEKVEGEIFHLADHDNSVIETYDERGEFISSRRMRPEEKQRLPFPIKKAQ